MLKRELIPVGSRRGRIIFHVDMNSFYASVETAFHPELKGKPLAVAGDPRQRHGIVVTSSYEARKRGVRTTMTVQEARRRCPELIVRHPDFTRYRAVSGRLFHLLEQYTSLVEKASIDEGYMDLTDRLRGADAPSFAARLQRQIKDELDLPSSIGIAPNKFLAKTASNLKKPMGLTMLRKCDLAKRLWPLSIVSMHGVGLKTARRLQRLHIATIGDLAASDPMIIKAALGISGLRLLAFSRGEDDRPVDPAAWERYKSIGHSITLPRDTRSEATVYRTLGQLAERLTARLKCEHIAACGLTLTVRYADWQTITRNRAAAQPMEDSSAVLRQVWPVFQKNWNGRPIRLLGLTLMSFQPLADLSKQLDLFSYEREMKREPLVDLVDRVNEKYGEGTLVPAASLIEKKYTKN